MERNEHPRVWCDAALLKICLTLIEGPVKIPIRHRKFYRLQVGISQLVKEDFVVNRHTVQTPTDRPVFTQDSCGGRYELTSF